jgi:hypothetical protein
MSSTLIITSCTNKKRHNRAPISLEMTARFESLEATISQWRALLDGSPLGSRASDLYVGRSFSAAKQASAGASGELLVVSAGLGLTHESDYVPSYNLTFADVSNPLALAMKQVGFSPSDWWESLAVVGIGRGSLSSFILAKQPKLVLIALPSGYLNMVRNDLASLPDSVLSKLRIFTSRVGSEGLEARLGQCVVQYDDRLESVPKFAGTRTDFPQRALLHFVTVLSAHKLDLAAAKKSVSAALFTLSPPQSPTRVRMNDEQIARILREQWSSHGGNSSRLLRFLRRDAHISCEQGRFKNIWHVVKRDLITTRQH